MLAAFQDCIGDLNFEAGDWDLSNHAMRDHFGVETAPTYHEQKEQFAKN
jgi:hypothetical protein